MRPRACSRARHQPGRADEQGDQQSGQESFHPNDKGASLIANPIADGVADVLKITAPKPSDGRMTVPKNIDIRIGVSDRDGDRVADHEDRAPDDPGDNSPSPGRARRSPRHRQPSPGTGARATRRSSRQPLAPWSSAP